MAKIFAYTIMMASIWMLLFFSGLSVGSNHLLDVIGVAGGSIASNVAAVVSIFALGGVISSIVVGFITRQSPESALTAGFTGFLLAATCYDFISIINYFTAICPATSNCNFVGYIISFIFIILWAGYLIAIVQWWRGND